MSQDRWARWVLRLRDSGDVEVRTRGASLLAAYRDGVLDRAAVREGDVLLDVGTGDGLVGFGALDRVGPDGRVIFSDVSADLLAECRRRAAREGLLDRCRFVQTGADELRAIPDGSIDVVTTRSVLIYPLAPTYEEALAQALTGPERDRFEDHVRAVLAAGAPGRKTLATAYLQIGRASCRER